SQDDLLILTSFGSQIATALKNAQTFEQVIQAEKTAQVSQARTEAILQSVSLPLVITRISDGLAMYANEPLAQTLGMELADIVGQRSPDFYYDANDRAAFLKTIQEQGYAQNYELRLKRIDGEPFWALVSSRPLIYDGDNAIITTITDITDRKEAQERTETILKSVNLPLAITRISDGYGLYANEPFAETFKISTADFVGQKSPSFYANPEDRIGLLEGVEKDGYIRNYEALLKRHTGELFWAILSSRTTVYEGHESIMTTILDITERKALQEELQLLKQAVDANTQPITIADARQEDMPLVYINPAFAKITGYSIEESLGQNCRFLQNDDVDQEGLKILREAIKNGESCDVEIRNYQKDGTLFWNRLNLSPVKNALGEVTHYVGSQHDITRQKQDEQRLAKQAADLATVAEVSTAVSTIQNTNDMLERVVDLTKERFNLYHAHIFTLNDASDTLILRAGAGEIGREMVAEGRQIPLTAAGSLVAAVGRNKSGQIRNYEGEMEGYAPHPALIDTRTELAVPLIVGDELLGVLDVRSEQPNAFTETDVQIQTTLASQIAIALQNARSFEQMKAAEQELRTSSEFLDAVLEAIPNPIFVKDQNHRWLILNGTMTEWMGQSAEHFIGKSDYDFFPKKEADIFWEKDDLVFKSNEPVINEELFTDATGFQRTIITTKVSHTLNTNEQILIGSILDITHLKEIDSELRASQTQLQA
ncbi:MAG: PAS domain S-box protein, partial [Anaerolineales bacterium]|nr:PAS domain S-box protein [Anaerolineales bacterium]